MAEYAIPVGMTLFPYVGALPFSKLPSDNMKWYDSLKHPRFCPPKYVFGPAWAALYGCMGYASYCVLRDAPADEALPPLALYSTHLLFNWSWTPIFFGAHKIKLGAISVVSTTVMATATALSFRSVSDQAFKLMIPYVLWLIYASSINIGTCILNKDKIK